MNRDALEALRAMRERATDAPPFDRVWRAALERRETRRLRRRLVHATVALSAAALLVVVLMRTPSSRTTPPESVPAFDREASELAHSLSDWSGPLDFLLEPPGGHLFGLDPWSPALRVPAELPTLKFEEIL